MEKGTIGYTISNCRQDVKDTLKSLFDYYGTLGNILSNEEHKDLYCRLMIHVIMEREQELGHIKYDWNGTNGGWNNFTYRPYEEVRKDYAGTIVMPF